MKAILAIIPALLLGGCGTLGIKVPPGSLTEWDHSDSYGPWQDTVQVLNVAKQPDGTFIMARYEGRAQFLGFGVHDVLIGLHVDPSGALIPPK